MDKAKARVIVFRTKESSNSPTKRWNAIEQSTLEIRDLDRRIHELTSIRRAVIEMRESLLDEMVGRPKAAR